MGKPQEHGPECATTSAFKNSGMPAFPHRAVVGHVTSLVQAANLELEFIFEMVTELLCTPGNFNTSWLSNLRCWCYLKKNLL